MKYPLVWAILIALVACKSDKPAPASTTPPAPVKPEVYLYMATVENLRVREAPNQSARVVAQLAEGEFVEGSGAVSDNKDEIELRGRYFNEPYIEVTTTTLEPRKGWAYGGGLLLTYAGSRAESPDLGRIMQYAAFLKSLSTKQLESGRRVWSHLRTNFADAKGSLADAVFVMTEDFLRRMEHEGEFYKETENKEWTEQDYREIVEDKFDYGRYPFTQNLPACGFKLETGEGTVFPVPDWKQYEAFFAEKTTPAMRDYIRQRAMEYTETAWSDAALIIPIEELIDRAAFWEKFNDQYPYFILSRETTNAEEWMRFATVSGADNTPAYDWETKDILPEFRKAWEYAQKKYPNTRLTAYIQKMSDLCAKNGWKYTDEARRLIEAQWEQQIQ